MDDQDKTKLQLESELAALRRRIGQLEAELAEHSPGWDLLQDDEDQYRAAFDNVADAIVINVGADRVLMNRAFLTLHGLEDEAFALSVPLDYFILSEDRPMVSEWTATRERGEPVPGLYEYRIKRLDGSIRMVEATAVATSFRGQPASFSVLRDITERKAAEEEQQHRAQEMATLYSVANTLAQPGTFKERVANVLESLVELTQADQVAIRVPDEKGLGLVVLAAAGPAVRGDTRGAVPYTQSVSGRAFTGGEPVIVNDWRSSPLASPNGVVTGIESIASLPVKATGHTIGVLNILSRDPEHFTPERVRLLAGVAGGIGALVENARLYETLQRRADELARSNADLEQFAYVASHDLQEPLRSVAGFTSLLARRYEGKLGEDADRFIGRAVAAATRMQELINDLLAYSRVGRDFEGPETMDTEALLAHEIYALQAAIEESGAEVTHGPLPPIVAGPILVGQVLRNLIGNAIKYRGEAPPRIHVSLEEQDQEWKFTVQDNGIGIEPQYAERIFNIFQRLHTRDEYPGTGIGLSICKKAVEHLGGQIWVDSQLGKGSTFSFTVPVP